MTEPPNDRLQQILGGPLLQPLVDRLAKRLARKPEAIGQLTLSKLSSEESDAIRALLGKEPSGGTRVVVDLEQLQDIILKSGAAEGIVAAVESIIGSSLVDQAAAREAARENWRNLPQTCEDFALLSDPVQSWIVRCCENGSLRNLTSNDLSQATMIVHTTVAALLALPPESAVPLPVFAQSITGDSHAFDSTEPLGRFLVRTIAATAGFDPSRCDSIEQRRQIWASVDVVVDELSSTVLLLNLPSSGQGMTDQTLRLHAEAGEPLRLTFRQLRVSPPMLDGLHERPVFVCENPSILALAADKLGSQCAPLICTDGVPGHAVTVLLTQLVAAGAQLQYHGDFDWPGMRMAQAVMSRHTARPWRLSDEDYGAAADGRALKGKPLDTPWCPALRDAMIARGRIVLEEEVVEQLIADLQQSGDSP